MTGNVDGRDVARPAEVQDENGGLTAREREVLDLVAVGLRDEEIAARVGIAHSTVATLLRSSMAKLDARSRLQAVAKLQGNQA
jgi:DNA-binding CsgD family transcriptional regulator